jgi:thiol-disulfide isomerase/thioredoxin
VCQKSGGFFSMSKNKKPLIILGIIIVLAIAFFILAKNPGIIYAIFNINQDIALKDGMTLSDPYFSDKIIIIHSPSCPHCLVVVPILEQIEQENNLTFYYYDVTKKADVDKITNLGLVVQYVPDVIIYGKVYVGERTKEQYEQAILNR